MDELERKIKRVEDFIAWHERRRDNPHQVSGGDIDHGDILGLSDDDHTQYLLADGSRTMTGNLDMDGNDVVDAINIYAGSAADRGTFYALGEPMGTNGGRIFLYPSGEYTPYPQYYQIGVAADFMHFSDDANQYLKFARGDGEIVINDGGGDINFRVEGDTDANLFFSDAGSGSVGIGTATPTNGKLHVQGTGAGRAGIYLNSAVPGTTSNVLYNDSGVLKFNGGVVGYTDHGDLGGLSDDDHTQYLLADGTRKITGDQKLDDGIALKWQEDGQSRYGGSIIGYVTNVGALSSFLEIYAGAQPYEALSVFERSTLKLSALAHEDPPTTNANNASITLSSFDEDEATDGVIWLNSEQDNVNTRISGASDISLFFADAGNDRIGIGNNIPTEKLDVTGNMAISGTVDGRDIAADGSKLDGIESGADVTDATNVAAAGAIMGDGSQAFDNAVYLKWKNSGGTPVELIRLDSSNNLTFRDATYGNITAKLLTGGTLGGIFQINVAGGESGLNILQKSGATLFSTNTKLGYINIGGGALTEKLGVTGNIAVTGTVDGRDVAADGSKLDGIEAGAEVNDVDSVNGQTGVVVLDPDDLDDTSTTHKFTSAAEISKLAGIETGADVTDAANVLTALANMSASVVVINENGNDTDLRVEGDTQPNLFIVDAGGEYAGVLTDVESYSFTIHNDHTNGKGIRIKLNTVAATNVNNHYLLFYDGAWGLDGAIGSDTAGGVAYWSASDERLKKNIKDYKGALEKLSRIKVREYEMIDQPGKPQTGVIAQELFDVFPDAVAEPQKAKRPAKDKAGNDIEVEHETPWMVDYTKFIPLLISAVQEQQEQINELRNEIEKLKGKK